MTIRIIAAATLLVAGTLFAAAQQPKNPQAPELGTETGMPSDQGQKAGAKTKGAMPPQTTGEGRDREGVAKQPGGAPANEPPENRDTTGPGSTR